MEGSIMNKNKLEIRVCCSSYNYYVRVTNYNGDGTKYYIGRNQCQPMISKEETILHAVADSIGYDATVFLDKLRERKILEYLRKRKEINNSMDNSIEDDDFLLEVNITEKTIDGDCYLAVEVTKTMMDMNMDTKSYYYSKPLLMPIEAIVLFALTKWLGCYPELFLKCFFVTEKNK